MNTILFLDIDGVINPHNYASYPQENKLQPYIFSLLKRNPNIRRLPSFTVDQVAHFFDRQACLFIQKLIKEFNCKLVISSSWRCVFNNQQLKAVLDLQDLGFAFMDTTDTLSSRPAEIKDYIYKHSIERYLVIDDFNMESSFHEHFILTKNLFTEANYQAARKALKDQYEEK